jgi:hypothetical protein
MKARDWIRHLESQKRQHGKVVFTVTELANIAGSPPHALNVELDRLVKQELIVRLAHGRYGLPDAADAETLLPYIDGSAYITGALALFRHNLITQAPSDISCFTNRRHNRSRSRLTALGQMTFVCVRPPVYAPPTTMPLAPPEQALYDLVFMMRRRGIDPRSQYTFRRLERLDREELRSLAMRYPATTRKAVAGLVGPTEAEKGGQER